MGTHFKGHNAHACTANFQVGRELSIHMYVVYCGGLFQRREVVKLAVQSCTAADCEWRELNGGMRRHVKVLWTNNPIKEFV